LVDVRDPLPAARYDVLGDAYAAGVDDLSSPAATALLAAVGDCSGLAVLDLACGHGVIARALANLGARVTGLDLAETLLNRAIATESAAPLGITYQRGYAADASVLEGQQLDRVVCNFGLSDIDELAGACATVARLLSPGGRFVFSFLHPCFAGDTDISGSWPSAASYRDERWWRADGQSSTLRAVVGANHRTLTAYINTLIAHGPRISHLDEPAPEPSWITAHPIAARQPVYLVIACQRNH
jgi:2-polyprenyl-3-methyl-5-hydroxy-6-metoxy-1,4-benzoquinol methylase